MKVMFRIFAVFTMGLAILLIVATPALGIAGPAVFQQILLSIIAAALCRIASGEK